MHDQSTAISRLLMCVSDIDRWMSSNRLKLNTDKTEFIWLGTRQQLAIEAQYVTTADQEPGHYAVKQSP